MAIAPNRSIDGTSVAYTGTAGNTAVMKASPFVLVWCSTDAYVVVGDAVVAVATDTPIPAGTPVVFAVPPNSGAGFRVSAIQISAGGTVYAKPVNEQ